MFKPKLPICLRQRTTIRQHVNLISHSSRTSGSPERWLGKVRGLEMLKNVGDRRLGLGNDEHRESNSILNCQGQV